MVYRADISVESAPLSSDSLQAGRPYTCFTCGHKYIRDSDKTYPDGRCQDCSGLGRPVSVTLDCGRMARTGVLASGTHRRRNFLRRGEDWSCPVRKSTYDSLSGSSHSTCNKRASIHIQLPFGTSIPSSTRSDRCGVVCEKHSKSLLTSGAQILSLSPTKMLSRWVELENWQKDSVISTGVYQHASGLGSMVKATGELIGTSKGNFLFISQGSVVGYEGPIAYWSMSPQRNQLVAIVALDSSTFLSTAPNDSSKWHDFLRSVRPRELRIIGNR